MKHRMRSITSTNRRSQSGMALPLALLSVIVLAAAGALLSRTSIESLQTIKLAESTADAFEIT